MTYKLFIWVKCDGGVTSQVVEFPNNYLADMAFQNLGRAMNVNVVKLY